MQALLTVHIVAGGLAIVLGTLALLAAKGRRVHRKAGLLFVYVTLTMGTSASVLALRHGFDPNFFGGLTTAYFVVTALMTVHPVSDVSRRVNIGAMALAFTLAACQIALGVFTLARGNFAIRGVPVAMVFFMASVALAAGLGDVRVIRAAPLGGVPRLRRHLWRMCFALFIAAGSFFSVRARVARIFPEPFLSAPVRTLPILLVFVAMFYWLWRVRRRMPVLARVTTEAAPEL